MLKKIVEASGNIVRLINKLTTPKQPTNAGIFVNIKIKFQKKDFKELGEKKLQELLNLMSEN